MRYHSDGSLYKAINITGPTHNLLGLVFSDQQGQGLVIEPVMLDPSQPPRVSADVVRQQVVKGVAQANRGLGLSYRVAKIQFVLDDSPSDDIYREMALRIVRRLYAQRDSFDGRDP